MFITSDESCDVTLDKLSLFCFFQATPSEVQHMIAQDYADDDEEDDVIFGDRNSNSGQFDDNNSLDDVKSTGHLLAQNSNNNASSFIPRTKNTANGHYSLLVNSDTLLEESSL